MIWFRCSRCGKTHGRGENLSGTIVFCTCGLGNRVPWSSTASAPAVEEESLPAAIPVPSDPPRRSPPPPEPRYPEPSRRPPLESPRRSEIPRSVPRPPPQSRDEPREPPAPAPKKIYIPRRIRPEFCLHHDETPSTASCDACRQRFCAACVVSFQGQTLCAACKNFRLRGLGKPAKATPLSILALVVALAGGPVTFCLGMSAFSAHVASADGSIGLTVILGVIGLLLPAAGLTPLDRGFAADRNQPPRRRPGPGADRPDGFGSGRRLEPSGGRLAGHQAGGGMKRWRSLLSPWGEPDAHRCPGASVGDFSTLFAVQGRNDGPLSDLRLSLAQRVANVWGARCPNCREPALRPARAAGARSAARMRRRASRTPDSEAVSAANAAAVTVCETCRCPWRGQVLCVSCVERAYANGEAESGQGRLLTRQSLAALLFGSSAWLLSAPVLLHLAAPRRPRRPASAC